MKTTVLLILCVLEKVFVAVMAAGVMFAAVVGTGLTILAVGDGLVVAAVFFGAMAAFSNFVLMSAIADLTRQRVLARKTAINDELFAHKMAALLGCLAGRPGVVEWFEKSVEQHPEWRRG